MTTMSQSGPPVALIRAFTGVRLPQRELAATRAEAERGGHQRGRLRVNGSTLRSPRSRACSRSSSPRAKSRVSASE